MVDGSAQAEVAQQQTRPSFSRDIQIGPLHGHASLIEGVDVHTGEDQPQQESHATKKSEHRPGWLQRLREKVKQANAERREDAHVAGVLLIEQVLTESGHKPAQLRKPDGSLETPQEAMRRVAREQFQQTKRSLIGEEHMLFPNGATPDQMRALSSEERASLRRGDRDTLRVIRSWAAEMRSARESWQSRVSYVAYEHATGDVSLHADTALGTDAMQILGGVAQSAREAIEAGASPMRGLRAGLSELSGQLEQRPEEEGGIRKLGRNIADGSVNALLAVTSGADGLITPLLRGLAEATQNAPETILALRRQVRELRAVSRVTTHVFGPQADLVELLEERLGIRGGLDGFMAATEVVEERYITEHPEEQLEYLRLRADEVRTERQRRAMLIGVSPHIWALTRVRALGEHLHPFRAIGERSAARGKRKEAEKKQRDQQERTVAEIRGAGYAAPVRAGDAGRQAEVTLTQALRETDLQAENAEAALNALFAPPVELSETNVQPEQETEDARLARELAEREDIIRRERMEALITNARTRILEHPDRQEEVLSTLDSAYPDAGDELRRRLEEEQNQHQDGALQSALQQAEPAI